MKKTTKKAKSPAKSAKRKVAIKDLKAKNAATVKGGVLASLSDQKILADKDIKLNPISTTVKW